MSKLLQSQGPLLALFGLVVLFSVLTDTFASWANLGAVLEAAAIPAVVAIGLTFVLMQASIDLSVEGVASLANIILSITVANSVTATDIGLWAVPLVLGVGLAVGATSGAVSIYVRMPSLIVTLGMWLTTVGLAALLYPGRLPQILETRVTGLAIGKFWGLNWIVYLTLALIIVALRVERHTRFGRMCRAIGENEPVLIMSGIKVIRHKIAAFALAGGCYAAAGILMGARIGVGNTQSGVGLLFPSIAACVLGGTLLAGGHGGVRLLLNSANAAHPGGIGNSTGLLGRYFTDQLPMLALGHFPDGPAGFHDDSQPADPFYDPSGGIFIPRFTSPDRQDFNFQGGIGRGAWPEAQLLFFGFGQMKPRA